MLPAHATASGDSVGKPSTAAALAAAAKQALSIEQRPSILPYTLTAMAMRTLKSRHIDWYEILIQLLH